MFGVNRIGKKYQYLISTLFIGVISSVCYASSPIIGSRVVALVLLISVSLLAMFFDILPVLFAAVLSALIWDFFFIPPYFTFHVDAAEDSMLLSMYFVIAMVHAVLTYKIRKVEKTAIVKEEKENSVKLYNTMLNSLSHELRTPIATIVAATDNLQAGGSKLTEYNKYELVNEIAKASFRLNQQVENLLNMSRIESGFIKPKPDWCDMNEVIYNVVKRIEEGNINQSISININPDIPFVKVDKGMVEQVIYNILINAVTHTAPDSKINIMCLVPADILTIVVEDNGSGFPKEEIGEVFNKFYRLKNTKATGTGLGLSIVKGFTEAMNGKVWLENIKSGGARFMIEIPVETSYLKNLKNE